MTTSGTAHARASGTPVLGAVLGHITDLEAIVGRGAQVSDALRSSIGFDLVGFAGFAVDAEAQERLATGKVGATDVALLLVNPDLLVGDLLRNTTTSQTFRLYWRRTFGSIRRRMASGCMLRATLTRPPHTMR